MTTNRAGEPNKKTALYSIHLGRLIVSRIVRMSTAKDQISIVRFEPLLETTTASAGANLGVNAGFEQNDFSGWNAVTNFTIVDATVSDPEGIGDYAARANSGTKGVVSSIETDRVAVSAGADYFFSLQYGAPTAAKKKNNIVVQARFWSAATGGSLIQTRTLKRSPVRPSRGLRYLQKTVVAPAGATHASLYVRNKYAGAGVAGRGMILDSVKIAARVDTPVATPLETWQHADTPRPGRVTYRDLVFEKNWQQGFKLAKFKIFGSAEYLWHLLNSGLGNWIEVYGQTSPVALFEGTLWTLKGRIGEVSYEASLDTLGNFVRVPYGDEAKPDTYTAQDTESILKFGRKDIVVSELALSEKDARDTASYLLAQFANPIPAAVPAASGERDVLDIEVMGLFGTLQWITGLAPVYVGELDVTTIAIALLNRLRFETPNAFLSGEYTDMDLTGRLLPPLEQRDKEDAQATMQYLIGRGAATNRALVAGVGPERRFFLRERPRTLAYFAERGTDGELDFYDAGGAPLERALVEPGQFMILSAPAPQYSVTRPADIAKDISAKLITNTAYDHEKNSMRIETLGHKRFDVGLARALGTRGLGSPGLTR